MLFLKIFDAKEEEWELLQDDYKSVIPKGYRWRDWAADDEGMTGDELLDFVNNDMFSNLKDMEVDEYSDVKKYVVKAVFEDSYNYMKSGTLLRQVANKLNEIDFSVQNERHLFNDIYEKILKDLQSAGNAGEYYTPRAVTQFIIDILNPKIGEKVLDPACGTGGFLICALEHLRKQVTNIGHRKTLQNSVLGVEKKPMPHVLAMTNMILHDIDVPKIDHDNSLSKNVRDYKSIDKIDVVATNPPFGGIEEAGIETNFPAAFRTKETADLFLILIMYRLKENGRAGIVLPDGFLFGEGVKTRIKEKLLEKFNLHTIVRLPNGVFSPYTGIKTNLLFFEKGESTKEIWYFEHPYPPGYKSYSKTKPIRIEEFDFEKKWWNNREITENSWKVTIEEIKARNYNLDISNPHKAEEEISDPKELLEKYEKQMKEVANIRDDLKAELQSALLGD
jgi:type I restriction enzyme M protein